MLSGYFYQFIRPSALALEDDSGILIPRHERWPVLMSTQGYHYGLCIYINSAFGNMSQSHGRGDMVSEKDCSLVGERGHATLLQCRHALM